jgi:hypothetical protein
MPKSPATPTLADLLAKRRVAFRDTFDTPGILRDMAPADRRKVDAASKELAATTRQIVAELRKRKGPAPVGPVLLHLNADLDGFLELDPKTRTPVHVGPTELKRGGWRGLLFRYPTTGRTNCPEAMP